MAKGNKRKPDLRKIRTTKVYRIHEIATTLNRDIRTVGRWIKDGLPVISDTGSVLIYGAALKDWLRAQSLSNKQKCLPNEFYCFKCRRPRNAKYGSISFQARNTKTMTIKALCGVCGIRMNKAAASADLAQVQVYFQQNTKQMPHLVGCDDTSLNKQHSMPASAAFAIAGSAGQKSDAIEPQTDGKLH